MTWLLTVYIAATVFGVAITLLDIIGTFGEDSGARDSGDSWDGESGESGESVDGGNFSESDSAASDNGADSTELDLGGKESMVAHDKSYKPNLSMKIISWARSIIYFSLGFGPSGWFAWAKGISGIGSLVWSVPVGLVSMVGARFLKRYFLSETDSSIKPEDLIMDKGTVIVTIAKGQVGKIRVKAKGSYTERYAKAAEENESIPLGETVYITDIGDDCVYVKKE